MNRSMITFSLLATLLTAKTVSCRWYKEHEIASTYRGAQVIIINSTQNTHNIHAYFYGCTDDHGYIEPGQKLISAHGYCQLERIDIDGFGTIFKGPYLGKIAFEIVLGSDNRPHIVNLYKT